MNNSIQLTYFNEIKKVLLEFKSDTIRISGVIPSGTFNKAELMKYFNSLEFESVSYVNSNKFLDKDSPDPTKDINVKIRYPKNYFRNLNHFLEINGTEYPSHSFYIGELNYFSSNNETNELIEKYKIVLSIIEFLINISKYYRNNSDNLELFFHHSTNIYDINIKYSESDLERFELNQKNFEVINEINSATDRETKKDLFVIELFNVIKSKQITFSQILESWSDIVTSYNNSYQIYLSDFSYHKMKLSANEDFRKINSEFHSTFQKYSTYILSLPIGFILLLRFFDYKGHDLLKNLSLFIISILYVIIIDFVMLDSLKNAIESIEKEIQEFKIRFNNSNVSSQILVDLDGIASTSIPKQKKKICFLRITTYILLGLVIFNLIFIHFNYIVTLIHKLIIAVSFYCIVVLSNCGITITA